MDWLFHTRYHMDLFLAVIPLQLVMLVYYVTRRHLPVRESRSFFYLMVLNLATLVTDIIACGVTVPGHSREAIYFWNILYYTSFILVPSSFLLYTADVLHIPDFAGRWTKAVLFLPSFVLLIFLFTTPLTGFFFSSSVDVPYRDGPIYHWIYDCYVFYVVMALVLVLAEWRKNLLFRNISFLVCGGILLLGIYLRSEFRDTLVLAYFFTLAILIGYLTVRNPDFYVDDETNLLNGPALGLVYEDRSRLGSLTGFGFVIKGYEQSRAFYGSDFIDSFLKEIGDYLMRALPRCSSFYIREGRFVVVTPSEREVEPAAEKVKRRFKESWVNGKRTAFFDITCIFLGPKMEFGSAEKFHLMVDGAFRTAKGPGVGDICLDLFYMKSLERSFHIHRLLAKALETDSLEVYLQPLVDGKDFHLKAAEALVRLKDTDGSMILPGEFISRAEENGSIALLGLEVFEKVCRFIQGGGLARCGMDWVQVNLSPTQCLDRNLPDKLDGLRRRYGVPLSAVRLEITEEAAFASSGYDRARELEARGYVLVLDDYGTGHSNRFLMTEIPMAGIKLDRLFVESHFKNPDAYLPNLIRGMRLTGYEVTAEGVETAEMAERLSAMGCSCLQGFYFSPPLPMDAFVKKYGK